MKIVLDIDDLLASGRISPEEAERFKLLARRDTGSLAVRILVVFGVIAVILGLTPFLPESAWKVLGDFAQEVFGTVRGQALLSMLLGVTGFVFNSGFLVTCSALALFALCGSATSYNHASYSVFISKPMLTTGVFLLLGCVALVASYKLPVRYERPATIYGRACLFLCNMGFWIGSLWGEKGGFELEDVVVLPVVFSIVWAVALLIAAVVAVRLNRRTMLNMVAVFAGIHFYTQWFENWGATPGALSLAGVALLLMAYCMLRMNRWLAVRRVPSNTTGGITTAV